MITKQNVCSSESIDIFSLSDIFPQFYLHFCGLSQRIKAFEWICFEPAMKKRSMKAKDKGRQGGERFKSLNILLTPFHP